MVRALWPRLQRVELPRWPLSGEWTFVADTVRRQAMSLPDALNRGQANARHLALPLLRSHPLHLAKKDQY
jgi:hypothetical protein